MTRAFPQFRVFRQGTVCFSAFPPVPNQGRSLFRNSARSGAELPPFRRDIPPPEQIANERLQGCLHGKTEKVDGFHRSRWAFPDTKTLYMLWKMW